MPMMARALQAQKPALKIAAILFAAFLGAPHALSAQVSPPKTQPPVVGDTTKIPKTKADSIAAASKLRQDRTLIVWDPPDSVMQELVGRKGYRQVRYQGDRVQFDSKSGLLRLFGAPAAVERDATMIVSDTIIYNDSTKRVLGLGDSVTLRDPTRRDGDDVVVHGKIDYDLNSQSGAIGSFSTSVESSGQRLYLEAKGGDIYTDTLVAGRHMVYARDGSFTYCDEIEPHFHFTTKEMKFVSNNIMVARPGVLYIGEVPVFWIPFFFQDVRSGRRSGLLTPSFGIAELLRNSPSYRRQLNNLGYFFAINDYMDAELSFDWRSGANGSYADPGFVRSNLEYRYRWISRFVTGRFAVERTALNTGSNNLAITWNHSQDFSRQTRLTSNLNWAQSTTIQQQTTTNVIAASATILSQLNYQTKVGPASVQIGGSRRQYPGRTQIETDFPSLSLTTAPLALGQFGWTPGGRVAVQSASGLDQGLQFPFVYTPKRDGGIGTDSARIKASRRTIDAGFESPIKIYGFQWQNSFMFRDQFFDYPEQRTVINVNNPADSATRIFARTFQTNFDWNTSFNLPRFFTGSWNLSPNISFNNVDPGGGLFVRTERSGGEWVGQSKRPSFSLSASPTFYAQFPGIGPITRFRHSISPSITYSMSPSSNVSDEFLKALGRTRTGYLGALAQNRIGLSLATNIEGKLRSKADTTPDAPAKKMQLLSVNVSSLTWDFIRADTAGTGLVEPNISFSARSDLIPNLNFQTTYSLFQGDPLSDTATVKLFRTDMSATFSLNGKSPILAVIGRLFGGGGSLDDGAVGSARKSNVTDDVATAQRRQMSAAGSSRRGNSVAIPGAGAGGWSLSLQYNSTRQRPPRGGTIVINDITATCAPLQLNPIAYDNCVLNAQNSPPPGTTTNGYAIGGPTFISQPTQNITSNLGFNVTENWSAQWSTSYDVVRSRFANQQVSLQRQLHDWTTTFSFNQTPNGAFSFNFFIALKAQPALKFNYDKSTYRTSGGL
ncbi:MAG: putative LPS assembly protein LptD [Gemmatimonadaceae bacterium]